MVDVVKGGVWHRKTLAVALALASLVVVAATTDALGASCGSPSDYVVVNVRHDDPVRGLSVRTGPSPSSDRLGVIPAAGSGVDVKTCGMNG